jgi:transketolase
METPEQLQHLQDVCTQVRRDSLRMIFAPQSGHPGGALGCAEYFVALYFGIMDYKRSPFQIDGKDEDVFILSNGHICAGWYSTLARAGVFPVAELATFRKLNSRLQGHPATKEHLEGVRVATGSLGQGISVALGIAQGKKLLGDTRLVYCMMGDGEQNEGQVWEAAMYAAHHKIDNLIATIDLNHKQIDGNTDVVMDSASLADKYRAFNWEVLELEAGNDLKQVFATLRQAKALTGKGKPVMIILHTIMGKGVDYMEDHYEWHGKAPNQVEFDKALAQLPATLGDY